MKMENSFKCGFMQLKQKDAPVVKAEIMTGLGIVTRAAWHQRLNGNITPRQVEREYIQNVFKKYGIIDVWGDISKSQLKDRKEYLTREIQELVYFAYLMLGNYGLDRVIAEVTSISESIKSGKVDCNQIVTD